MDEEELCARLCWEYDQLMRMECEPEDYEVWSRMMARVVARAHTWRIPWVHICRPDEFRIVEEIRRYLADHGPEEHEDLEPGEKAVLTDIATILEGAR